MSSKNFDVIIVGGGMVGLVMAKILAQANFHVALIEAKQPTLKINHAEPESRVSALNLASINLLKRTSIWPHLSTSTPFLKMQIWDDNGSGEVVFDSADMGLSELGFIVENRDIVRTAWSDLQTQSHVKIYCPAVIENIAVEDSSVTVSLNHETLCAPLLIGADGANSAVREQLNFKMHCKKYEQQAVIAVLETEKKHRQIALQSFLTTGALGILPLQNPNQIAIVWSYDEDKISQILQCDNEKFNLQLQTAMGNLLGQVKLISDRKNIPLVARHAKNYIQPRVALIGDAAHTIHPLAGQGANLGFQDVESLAECLITAKNAKRDLGGLKTLRRYERSRKFDNQQMLALMRAFKTIFGSTHALVIRLRNFGLSTTNRITPLKNLFMKSASGEL